MSVHLVANQRNTPICDLREEKSSYVKYTVLPQNITCKLCDKISKTMSERYFSTLAEKSGEQIGN